MRILFTVDPEIAVPPVTYGGIERIADMLIRALIADGHEVGLAARAESTCPVAQLFPWPGPRNDGLLDTVRNTGALWRAAKSFQPDIIHSFSRLAYLLPHLRGPRPVIMSYQREISPRTVGLANRLAAPGRIAFAACSDYLVKLGRPGGGHWTAIHNFTDTARLTFRREVAPDAPLVFLSRVETIKGADVAIAIARRSGVRLVIAGNHSDSGVEGEYWRTRIAPEIGRDGIEYVGPVDDVRKNELLGQARAMLVPIQWDEPCGIVFAEALACGTPVISCPRGGVPEIVRDGQDGFLVRDVEQGVAAVHRLGEIDRAACRTRAEQHFSIDAAARRFVALYRERLGRA